MTVQIRPAGPADAAALAALAAVTFPLACPPSTTAEAISDFIARNLTRDRFAEYLADRDRTLLVAVADDAGDPSWRRELDGTSGLVGWSMLVRTEDGEPADADAAAAVSARPAVELSKMYAHPAAHGRGVAGELMRATLAEARREGAPVVWLGVNEENARAIRFYEKHGFAVVGTKRFRLGDRLEHDLVLERALP
ncbi:ribosomal protein S18 acetylase RimI-like enzyme [Agromyces flavus]|uniref:Ribosomal protein S18 acetylase RimI-like enzyme n=1 Tax=Agromyces flavus TaxID=589382 RepID=A0ABT1KHK2_9MICO|nr:GNAT family N-acetyltransferase [Agromyces flavus]MCP2366343.1 ribosomal protein S18 acetylase RimI-like enzyme [Agromyces flavus]